MLIDSNKYLDLLDSMVDQAQKNLQDYTDFHGEEKLEDLKNMSVLDAHLYGLARGKLEQLEYIRDMVLARMEQLGE